MKYLLQFEKENGSQENIQYCSSPSVCCDPSTSCYSYLWQICGETSEFNMKTSDAKRNDGNGNDVMQKHVEHVELRKGAANN